MREGWSRSGCFDDEVRREDELWLSLARKSRRLLPVRPLESLIELDPGPAVSKKG